MRRVHAYGGQATLRSPLTCTGAEASSEPPTTSTESEDALGVGLTARRTSERPSAVRMAAACYRRGLGSHAVWRRCVVRWWQRIESRARAFTAE